MRSSPSGAVQSWEDLLDVSGALVSFRSTNVFESDGAVLTSDSTLRFRSRDGPAPGGRLSGLSHPSGTVSPVIDV
jgi:hypothetical protein